MYPANNPGRAAIGRPILGWQDGRKVVIVGAGPSGFGAACRLLEQGNYDVLRDELMGRERLHHERESWVWIAGRFIPCPFPHTVQCSSLGESVVAGLLAAGFTDSPNQVGSPWQFTAPYGCPTAFLGGNEAIRRGRFGAWKYEVSNQDHTLMHGGELLHRFTFAIPELTYSHPNVVNRLAA